MKASDLVARARSVSDLPTSKYVSHADELNSLNESWKDIYSALAESDDDYFLSSSTVVITSANAVPGSQNEYIVTLPADVLKVRFIDWAGPQGYVPVEKFNISMKDDFPAYPRYRLANGDIWLIASNIPLSGISIRIGYYPTPVTVTYPQLPIAYGSSYTVAQFSSITNVCYAALSQTIVYTITNSTIITAESYTATTGSVLPVVALFTEATAVTNLVYYKGTLYWIRGGLIWYKPTQLAAAFLAPTQATTPAAVTSFYIVNDTIYYTNATQLKSCTLAGTSDTVIGTPAVAPVSIAVLNSTIYFVDTAGAMKQFSPALTVYAAGMIKVTATGTDVYVVDNTLALRKVLTFATATDYTIDTDILAIGQPAYDASVPSNLVGVIHKEGQTMQAEDLSVDYNFSYPNNLVPEIMAWQSAMDYRMKREADVSNQQKRLFGTGASDDSGLWGRFRQVIKRDEYKPERIRNSYPNSGWQR